MKATKGNREYTITEADKSAFIKEGFDIIDDTGAIIAYGAGKSVTYEKYRTLETAYQLLMEENADLVSKCQELEATLAKKASKRGKKLDEEQ